MAFSLTDVYSGFMFGLTDFQENIVYDVNGDEVYHGWGDNRIATTDALWVIGKAVYTPTVINGATVNLLTHYSFLRNQIWANYASIVFP